MSYQEAKDIEIDLIFMTDIYQMQIYDLHTVLRQVDLPVCCVPKVF